MKKQKSMSLSGFKKVTISNLNSVKGGGNTQAVEVPSWPQALCEDLDAFLNGEPLPPRPPVQNDCH